MNDLIEIVQDLDTIALYGSDSDTMDGIMEKWQQRQADAEAELARQYKFEFEMDDGVSSTNNGSLAQLDRATAF